jgi:phosphate-selective porin OprO and OprP
MMYSGVKRWNLSERIEVMNIPKILILIFIFMLPVNAWAEDELLEALRENGTLTQKQYEKLKKKRKESKKGRPLEGFRQQGQDFRFRVGGRLQLDGAIYDSDKTSLGSGTKVRRIRLFFDGKVYQDWAVRIQIGFADNAVTIRDAWMGYTGFDQTLVRVGNFFEPLSLEGYTSSRFDTFMEASLPGIFPAGRQLGVAAHMYWDTWTFSGGIFGERAGRDRADGEGFGASGRLTYSPVHKKTQVIHLGAGVGFRGVNDDTQSVRFSTTPESSLTTVSFVDTGDIADSLHYVNVVLEGAVVAGPYSIQGEIFRPYLHRKSSQPSAQFSGSYILASWFLTGESRPYSFKFGAFDRVKPHHNSGPKGIGAWEVAVRYSQIDLNDGVIRGGAQENIALALNWYPNPMMRLMTNVIFIDTDPVAGNENATAIQMRAQIDF